MRARRLKRGPRPRRSWPGAPRWRRAPDAARTSASRPTSPETSGVAPLAHGPGEVLELPRERIPGLDRARRRSPARRSGPRRRPGGAPGRSGRACRPSSTREGAEDAELAHPLGGDARGRQRRDAPALEFEPGVGDVDARRHHRHARRRGSRRTGRRTRSDTICRSWIMRSSTTSTSRLRGVKDAEAVALDEERRLGPREEGLRPRGCSRSTWPDGQHAAKGARQGHERGGLLHGGGQIGFSTRTSRPRSRKKRPSSPWELVGVATTTASAASATSSGPERTRRPRSRATSSARPSWWSWMPDERDARQSRARRARGGARDARRRRPRGAPAEPGMADRRGSARHLMKPRSLALDEPDELLDVGLAGELLGDPLEGLARVELRLDEDAVGLLERLDALVREAVALEADRVQAVRLRVEAVGAAERAGRPAGSPCRRPGTRTAPTRQNWWIALKAPMMAWLPTSTWPASTAEFAIDDLRSDPVVVGHVGVVHEVVVVADDASRPGRSPSRGARS